MSPAKGYYSIVQYCPELARREAVNIGVVLLVPERKFLDSRMVDNNKRVRHFFGTKGSDAKMLKEFKKSFQARIKAETGKVRSVECLQKFIDTRGNQIQLTTPAFVKVRQCAETIDDLFEQLVAGARTRPEQESFTQSLEKKFDTAGLANLIRRNVAIEVPILNREIKMPFAFQNGAFHLLRPVEFESKNEESNFERACKYSMEGKIFQEHPDDRYGQLQFNVIGRFSENSDSTVSMVRRVLDESKVQLYDERELSGLFEEIRLTSKAKT